MSEFLIPKGHTTSTEDVTEKERLEYWIDMICDEFVQLDCSSDEKTDFKGELRGCELDNIRVSEVGASSQHVTRSKNRSPNRLKASSC